MTAKQLLQVERLLSLFLTNDIEIGMHVTENGTPLEIGGFTVFVDTIISDSIHRGKYCYVDAVTKVLDKEGDEIILQPQLLNTMRLDPLLFNSIVIIMH